MAGGGQDRAPCDGEAERMQARKRTSWIPADYDHSLEWRKGAPSSDFDGDDEITAALSQAVWA